VPPDHRRRQTELLPHRAHLVLEQRAQRLDEGELDCLEYLLAEDDDHRLYAWIIGTEPTPEVHETPVMAKIRAFMRDHVASAVAEGAG
jgi:antitoxin CptB